MSEPEWTERDLLMANVMVTRNLASWLVVSGQMTPEKLAGLIQVTEMHLEKEGDPGGARKALKAIFGEELTKQLKNMTALLNPEGAQGSA